MWISSIKLINYLIDNGLYPLIETANEAYFEKDFILEELLNNYRIHECFSNKGMIPKRKNWII